MTTAIRSFAWSSATTAAAQAAWINGVRDLLLAAGLTQTTDTGQISAGDAYIPPGGGNLYGYHMFAFPDALQATTPILLRVDYKYNSNSDCPLVLLTVGSATDGAGNLTGATYQTSPLNFPNGPISTPINSYACYVDGTFACVLGYGFANSGGVTGLHLAALVLDRARTTAGVAQDGGWLAESTTPSNAGPSSRSMYGSSPPAAQFNVPGLIPSIHGTGSADGTSVNVFRHYMMVPLVKPSLGSLSYFFGEFTPLVPITVTVLGSSHTYMPMGRCMPGWSATAALLSANGSPVHDYDHCGMIRWE